MIAGVDVERFKPFLINFSQHWFPKGVFLYISSSVGTLKLLVNVVSWIPQNLIIVFFCFFFAVDNMIVISLKKCLISHTFRFLIPPSLFACGFVLYFVAVGKFSNNQGVFFVVILLGSSVSYLSRFYSTTQISAQSLFYRPGGMISLLWHSISLSKYFILIFSYILAIFNCRHFIWSLFYKIVFLGFFNVIVVYADAFDEVLT